LASDHSVKDLRLSLELGFRVTEFKTRVGPRLNYYVSILDLYSIPYNEWAAGPTAPAKEFWSLAKELLISLQFCSEMIISMD
jgi:hypothetical protein